MNKMSKFMLMVCATFIVGTPVLAQTTTFKIATLAPEGSDWAEKMKSGAQEIKQRTGGRVVFKFYGGGVMGNDKKVLRKMRSGQLQGGAFTAGSLAERFPGLNLYGLPFLFKNLQEVDVVRAQLDGYMKQGLRESGLVSFGLASGGFAQIMSNVLVKNVDDLKGKRVWVPEGDQISYAAMQAFGLSPVTLPVTDVLTGLQTGLIDVIGSSAIGALVLQWHTKVSYVSSMPVSYLFGVMAIEDKYFEKLQIDDQKIVEQVFTGVYADLEKQNNIDNAKALAALQSSGMKLIEPDDGLLDKLEADSQNLWITLAKTDAIPESRLLEIKKLLSDFRTASAASAP